MVLKPLRGLLRALRGHVGVTSTGSVTSNVSARAHSEARGLGAQPGLVQPVEGVCPGMSCYAPVIFLTTRPARAGSAGVLEYLEVADRTDRTDRTLSSTGGPRAPGDRRRTCRTCRTSLRQGLCQLCQFCQYPQRVGFVAGRRWAATLGPGRLAGVDDADVAMRGQQLQHRIEV